MKKRFIFWSVGALGTGISGSDRIFIELARNWTKKIPLETVVWKEGMEMLKRQGLGAGKNLKISVLKIPSVISKYFITCYIARIIYAIKYALTIKITDPKNTFTYNSSDFWMDSLPCVILKLRYPKIVWVATWYMTAPNPLKGFSEAKRQETYKLSAFYYWLSQLPINPLVKFFADYVIVNNDDERKRFPKLEKKGKVLVLIGAVRLDDIKKYQRNIGKKEGTKNYDAVFQGRFHPQKGVVELVDIWKKVVGKIPKARLAMIGDGSLMKDVKNRIKRLKLEKNIDVLGYVFDGKEKYGIFSQSKIVVHPAYYDSGGMASAEAMAFGLPCVGFNLKAYESYYPKGMLKADNEDRFAEVIIKLLSDSSYRRKIGKEARNLIEKQYSWETRSEEILSKIL